ncbi:marine proteobacterial sortase target protein [Paraglaciecola aquimarina]|uniref:Marine proteobacterial sortase target protein n=1 Tax=Paraglaciecola aquimarina TaxID=1235557 RepID=A0ABU3SUN2_9ALTE|nr:marine proteobacterial sortase target protein [Paraglaciecola aquimarina]MDU0353702.1 marine proteobacterial sortase target protein [Paraglaciecola aquimarina]
MNSIPKTAIVALMVIGIGALQLAMPRLTDGPNTFEKAVTDSPAPLLKNMSVSPMTETTRGTLYLSTISKESSEASTQTYVSPLLRTDVDIKVTGIVARTRLTQTFKNAGNAWANAEYLFPLPENAAVDHLLITVGKRKIEGQIKEKSQAKAIYLAAQKQGKKASLVEQHRPNIFSNSIANIALGETIKVSIEYQQKLAIDNQLYSLRFPMAISPRYSPESNQADITLEDLSTKDSVSNHSHEDMNITVNLHSGFEIQDLDSEFHPIQHKQRPDGSHHIQLLENGITDRDFVLTWQAELGATPTISHFNQNVGGHEYGLLMVFPPKDSPAASKEDVQAREVIFVLDTSGSMEGDSIVQAKQALILAINRLTPQDTFNLIEFNNQAQNLWSLSKAASSANKKQAIRFVSRLEANGGTEMMKAFDLAFSLQEPLTPTPTANTQVAYNEDTIKLRQILFITDGSVSNEESLMQKISAELGASRLFTVGIGNAPNSYFMTEAAKMGKGTFTYIGSTEQVQEKMQTLLTKLEQPALTDIELEFASMNAVHGQSIELYPNIIADLYYGEPIVLSYRLTQSKEPLAKLANHPMMIRARFKNQAWEMALKLTATSQQSGLNVLWAREKISQLTRDKRRAEMTQKAATIQQEFKDQIIQTALNHHLVSQYTSLVAVDLTPTQPLLEPENNEIAQNMRAVRHATTQRKMLGSLPQTATNGQLSIIIGLILVGLAICMRLLTKRKIDFCN